MTRERKRKRNKERQIKIRRERENKKRESPTGERWQRQGLEEGRLIKRA